MSGLDSRGRREAASVGDSMCYKDREHLPTPGVKIMDAPFSLNRSIRIGSRRGQDHGAVPRALTGREQACGAAGWCGFWRSGCRTSGTGAKGSGIRSCSAWRERFCCWRGRAAGNTATPRRLRDTSASLRLATGDRAGTAPLGKGSGAWRRSRRYRGGWRRGAEVARCWASMKPCAADAPPKTVVIVIRRPRSKRAGEQPKHAFGKRLLSPEVYPTGWRRRGRRASLAAAAPAYGATGRACSSSR